MQVKPSKNAVLSNIFLLLMYLPKNIKHLRKVHKVSQTEVGAIVGVSHSQVGAYELGRSSPSLETLLLIAKLFNTSLDDLIFKDLSNLQYLSKPFPGLTVEEPKTGYGNMEKMISLFEHRIRELENYILDNCAEGAARLGIKKPGK